MIYVISKSTFGSYNVRDIQCNANWDCCPYSDYALIPDSLVDGILATQGYCDITLNSSGTEVVSFTARAIPPAPKECRGVTGAATYPKAVSGEVITADDSIAAPLPSLTLYGKTTQNGTPTPENPVELVSAGNGGSIGVTITDGTDENVQTLTAASTPNGLPGIPVASGGNYTDAAGQQWICDEMDFARGVYIQRVMIKTFNGTENWAKCNVANGWFDATYWLTVRSTHIAGYNPSDNYCLSNQYKATSRNNIQRVESGWCALGSNGCEVLFTTDLKTVEEWKAELAQKYAEGNPVKIAFVFSDPIETPLSAEELAQYAALHTNKPSTTVYNDAGAYMDVEYYATNAAVPVEAGAANEGKFLRVVNGAAAWVTVNSAEGGSF